MPDDVSGVYSLPEAAFTPATLIQASKVNAVLADIAAALTGRLRTAATTTLGRNLVNAADGAAARALIGAGPLPNGAAGTIGEWRSLNSIDGGNLTLPAGGVWVYFATRYVVSTGGADGQSTASAAAGGTILATGVAGRIWFGMAMRVS